MEMKQTIDAGSQVLCSASFNGSCLPQTSKDTLKAQKEIKKQDEEHVQKRMFDTLSFFGLWADVQAAEKLEDAVDARDAGLSILRARFKA